jgi:small conductance mechanosensitive channel
LDRFLWVNDLPTLSHFGHSQSRSTANLSLGTGGVIGLAIGLALQEPLSNLFCGIMLSLQRGFHAGDLVESNGHFGTIEEVNLRSTIMYVASGQAVTNSK